jgi:hypothetical protein
VSSVVVSLLHSFRFLVQSRASLHLEIIALRHQLAVINRSRRPRLRVTSADRILWAWLSRAWRGWRSAVHIVKPETVIAWHRRGFRLFWTWKSRHRTGRPGVPPSCPRGHFALSCASYRHADGRPIVLEGLSGTQRTADDHPHDDRVTSAATL